MQPSYDSLFGLVIHLGRDSDWAGTQMCVDLVLTSFRVPDVFIWAWQSSFVPVPTWTSARSRCSGPGSARVCWRALRQLRPSHIPRHLVSSSFHAIDD